jgi:hypothetical protein
MKKIYFLCFLISAAGCASTLIDESMDSWYNEEVKEKNFKEDVDSKTGLIKCMLTLRQCIEEVENTGITGEEGITFKNKCYIQATTCVARFKK